MKCINCGNENSDNSAFCATCGGALNQTNNVQPQTNVNNQQFGTFDPNQPVNNGGYAQPNAGVAPAAPVANGEDKTNIGLCILSFFIPLVGIILFFVYSDKPKGRKPYLITALISIVLAVLFAIVICVILPMIILNAAIDNIDYDDLTSTTTTTKVVSSDYNVGDPVTLLDGSEWHVLEQNGNKVILLSDIIVKEKSGYGKDVTESSQLYENSVIKEYLEGEYLTSLKSGLTNGDTTNLTVRLLTLADYFKYSKTDMSTAWGNDVYCYQSLSASASRSMYYHDKKFMSRELVDFSTYSYSDIISDVDKFHGMVGLTNNFWLGSSIKDRTGCQQTGSITYYGAYYVRNTSNDGEYQYPIYSIASDMEAVTGNYTGNFLGESTDAGIRPVLETSVKNIKK